jgi:MFS family permease
MSSSTITAGRRAAESTTFVSLVALSFSHLLNDMMQSLLPAIYPLLKTNFHLSFGQVGLITFTFQFTASLLQPVVGLYTDRRPMPFSLAAGMGFTLVGLLLLSSAGTFAMLLLAAGLVGLGSSVFHPESSRVARMASGGRHGMAQSLFQVGGNAGSAMGPLLAAFIVVPRGQGSVAWFSLAALLAMVVLLNVGRWYRAARRRMAARPRGPAQAASTLSRRRIGLTIAILLTLIFSKYFYLASLNTYFTFYLIHKFGVSVQNAQIHLFLFLAAVAAGTFAGGPIGDRQPVLDRRAQRGDRHDPGIRLLRHPGLCAGTGAGKGRHGGRNVLRLRLRHGRPGGRAAGRAGRPYRHRLRLQRLRVPAGAGSADRLPAEYRARGSLTGRCRRSAARARASPSPPTISACPKA